MAFRTVLAQGAGMRVVLLMAVDTQLWSRLQISNRLRALVAGSTFQQFMLSIQMKGHLVMAEVFSESLFTIVTVQTGPTKGFPMFLHKGCIMIAVAGHTDTHIHLGQTLGVTINALDGTSIPHRWVGSQREPHHIVREVLQVHRG